MRISVAVLDKKGDNATEAAITALKTLDSEKNEYYEVASPEKCNTGIDLSRQMKEPSRSVVAIASIFSERTRGNSDKLIMLEGEAIAFDGKFYSSKTRFPWQKALAEKFQGKREEQMELLLKDIEGDFAVVVAEAERILAARDPVGVQPLYYGENEAYAAIGSNRKVLWKLGLKRAVSFPPGNIAVVSRAGFRFKPVRSLSYAESKPMTMEYAASKLQILLERSVRLRVRDLREVAVAFSGGLDSSLVAILAKKCGVDVHLFHVSLRNQIETEEAKKAADELKLPLSVHLFEKEDVENAAVKVIELIEEPDPVKLAIGIPFYWTAMKTGEAGFRVLLSGQGADELFGGYRRYVEEYCLKGKEETRKTMFADVMRMHESNLERDKKICGFHNVELILPFASFQISEFATSLPIELKIEARADSLRKIVLRVVAEGMGLPKAIVKKPKKAVQYGTGINRALKTLAKQKRNSLANYTKWLFAQSST